MLSLQLERFLPLCAHYTFCTFDFSNGSIMRINSGGDFFAKPLGASICLLQGTPYGFY